MLFVAAYVFVVRPARIAWASHVALPVAEAARDPSVGVEQLPGEPLVVMTGGPRDERHSAPAGLSFLLAGAILTAAQPKRPWWAVLLGAHLALGALALGLFALGTSGWPLAFALQRFIATFLLDVGTLLVPVWVVFRPAARPAAA